MALAGLTAVVGEVADADAPLGLDVAGALVADALLLAAAAHGHADVALVLLKPVGEALDVQRLAVGGDGLFNGDDVHADAGAAGGHHLGHAREGQEGHALEEVGDDGLLVAHVGVDDHELCAAGDEHVQHPALLVVGVFAVEILPVVLDEAGVTQDLQRLLEPRGLHLAALLDDLEGDGLALFEHERNVQRVGRGAHAELLLRDLHRSVHAPVFRRVGVDLVDAEHYRGAVGDLLT